MGRYFNPATTDALAAAGARKLNHAFAHDDCIAQLQPGECLGWMLDRIVFHQVVDVTDRKEFREFVSLYDKGAAFVLGFYAIPVDAPGWNAPVPKELLV